MSIQIKQIIKERVRLHLITLLLLLFLFGIYLFNDSQNIYYLAKSSLYAWAGDTRLTSNHFYPISNHQLNIVCQQLQPGDILLTRHNGFISNFFIPGYWTHTAMYIGTANGFNFKNPLFKGNSNDINNNNHYVIEALSGGITLRTIEELLQADAFIVLRPIIQKDDIDIAINNAINQLGKPYDYDFDFNTYDKVACTELIYYSYNHAQVIIAHKMFGRLFTTPNDIIEDYLKQKSSNDQKLEFVLQMDERGVLEIEPNKLLTEARKFLYLNPKR